MALARSRQVARRVKDRWKAKQWYNITAPASFNNMVIGETIADDASKVVGRHVEATMQELTGDMRQMHVKVFFKINEVTDTLAKTEYIGHAMTSDYVRRLTRRGHTKIPAVFDVKTNDGSRMRLKPFAVSDRRAQTTAAQAIRATIQEMLTKAAAEMTQTQFLKEVLVGELTNNVYKECRKIHPLRRIEIAKVEVIRAAALVDETPTMIIEPEREEPVASDDDEAVEAGDDEVEATEDEAVEVVADDEDETVADSEEE